jgi:hypothetical protein
MKYVIQKDESCAHEDPNIGALYSCKDWENEYEVVELDDEGEYVDKIECCMSEEEAYELWLTFEHVA